MEIQIYDCDCFVFIDETGCSNIDHTRKFRYALGDEPAVEHRWVHRGTRISAIAAITSGMLAVELKTGSVNGDDCFDYVRGSQIPEMLLFDGRNPKSIAVLDNCSILYVRPVTQLFKDSGILTLFLPPYSPDLMPIEITFSYISIIFKSTMNSGKLCLTPKYCSRQHLTVLAGLIAMGGLTIVDTFSNNESLNDICMYVVEVHCYVLRMIGELLSLA